MIVRELRVVFILEPRGIRTLENGERQGFNTDVYSESEIRRIAHVAFQLAMQRNKKVLSVDKANVLEVTELWKEIATVKNIPKYSYRTCMLITARCN